jgi:signal transduction histidine kinase
MKSNSGNQAQEWVENAKNYYRSAGRKLALAEFSDPKGMFVRGEMYIFVLDSKGTMLAHGINKRYIGENFMEVKDSDEKFFIKEIIELATMDRSGWVEYKWFNPTTKEWDPKITYFEVVDDLIICSAVY